MQGRIDFTADVGSAVSEINRLRAALEGARNSTRLYGEYAGGIYRERLANSLTPQIEQLQKVIQAHHEGLRTVRDFGVAGQVSFNRIAESSGTANREIRHLVASFDELSRGQRGAFFSTMGAALRDAGISTGLLVRGIAVLGAVMAGIRVVEMVARWQDELGKAAQRQQGFAAAVGITGRDFAVLSDAMRLAGGNVETASRAFEILQRHMEEAVNAPSGAMMTAFRRIGLSFEELQKRLQEPGGAGIQKTLLDMGDAFVKMGESAQRTSLFIQLLGGTRTFAEVVRFLQGGSAGMRQLENDAKSLDAPFQNNLDKFVEMRDRIEKLSLAWEGYKASVVSNGSLIGSVIDNIIEKLKRAQEVGIIQGFLPRFGAQTGGGPSETVAPLPGHVFPYRGTGLPTGGSIGGYPSGIPNLAAGGALSVSQLADLVMGTESGFRNINSTRDPVHGGRGYSQFVDSTWRSATRESGIGIGYPRAIDAPYDIQRAVTEDRISRHGMGDWTGTNPRLRAMLDGGMASSLAMPSSAIDLSLNRANINAPISATQGYDETTAEKLYTTRVKLAQQAAEETHQYELQRKLLQDEASFMAMGPDARHEFLLQNVNLSKADAEAQIQLLGIYGKQYALQQSITQANQQTSLAGIQQQIAQAQNVGNLARIVELEKQRAALVAADPYATQAQRIEAQTRVIEAQNAAMKHGFQDALESFHAQERIGQDLIRGAGARASIASSRRGSGERGAVLGAEASTLIEVYQSEQKSLMTLMEMANVTGDIREKTKIYWMEWDLGVKSQTQALELLKKMSDESKKIAEEWAKPFKTAFDKVGSDIEASLKGLLTGKMTRQQAFANIGSGLIGAGVDLGGSIASKVAAGFVPGSKPGEGVGDALGNLASNWIGKQLSSFLPDMVKGTTQAAETAAPIVTAIGGSTAAIVAALQEIAGIEAAVFAKPSVLGTTFAYGGIVPAAAGGWALPSFGTDTVPAMLTPGETVLPVGERPSAIANSLRGAMANDGGAPTFNIHAIDTKSGVDFLMKHANTIAKAWSAGLKNGGPGFRAV